MPPSQRGIKYNLISTIREVNINSMNSKGRKGIEGLGVGLEVGHWSLSIHGKSWQVFQAP